MLKQLDKLILRAFFGPFLITFSVLVFIFLTQFLMKYFEELIGKDLGIEVYAELIFYFAMNMVPQAMPLSVLLASLMTYGTLGEHRELTAIKSAGISLNRIIKPIMVLALGLSAFNWFFYDRVVPKANLQAFSLLYDIRTKKLALDIKPGVFYYGLPGYAVKLGSKEKDGKTVKNVMIYDHSAGNGNNGVILADSGLMYTMMDDRYLVLELFKGASYNEVVQSAGPSSEFVQNRFGHSKMVFNLNSFDLNRTDIGLFSSNRLMRNTRQLMVDVDSLKREGVMAQKAFALNYASYYPFMFRKYYGQLPDSLVQARQKMLAAMPSEKKKEIATLALNQARNVKTFTLGYADRVSAMQRDARTYEIEIWRKVTQSFAVFVLFLIGAPLGSIIKKGGLGMPVIISIIFFIIFYVISITGEKWAKEGVAAIQPGMWAANFVLLLFGLYFLYLARTDSSILETDFYTSLFKKFRKQKAVS